MGIPVSHVRHTETNRTMPHASFASRYINRSDNMCTECTALTCLLCKRIATPAAFVDRVDENSVSPDVRAVVPQDLLFSLNNTISQLQCSSSPSISAIFTFEFKRFFLQKYGELVGFAGKLLMRVKLLVLNSNGALARPSRSSSCRSTCILTFALAACLCLYLTFVR